MAADNTAIELNREFEAIANSLTPELHRWERRPRRLITFEEDSTEYFGVKAAPQPTSIDKLPTLEWGKDDDFILDFGLHMVGFVSFKLESRGSHMDAPARLRLTFGESPLDVTMDMNNVKCFISTSWLPDEVINIDMCPEEVRLPRRYSFRFLRVTVIDTSPKFRVSLSEVVCDNVSAVSQNCPVETLVTSDPLLRDIDHVSISTLRDCMQTVFEDGPRRDRRLWMGDLRLQALCNYCTFRDFDLVKRSLFQFAAVARIDGSLPACVFEKPTLAASTDYIVDYDALFAATVRDYVVASGDLEVGRIMWPLVLTCVKRAIANLNPDTSMYEATRTEYWSFLDWQMTLDRCAGVHGLLIFCLKAVRGLGEILGLESPYIDTEAKMAAAAKNFISADGFFISGPEAQISFASAAWLTLSGALPEEQARAALLRTLDHPDAVKPLTPYLWHYVCEALAAVGCFEKCIEIMTGYWGGMVKAGADTFWEAFDPDNSHASPYGDVRNNSFCHAWSCTPTYLLRGQLREFLAEKGEPNKVTMCQLDELWVKRQTNQ